MRGRRRLPPRAGSTRRGVAAGCFGAAGFGVSDADPPGSGVHDADRRDRVRRRKIELRRPVVAAGRARRHRRLPRAGGRQRGGGADGAEATAALPVLFGHASACTPSADLEGMALHVGDHARGIPQQPDLGAIGALASPRAEDMGDDTVTVGLEPAPQPLVARPIGRIALGEFGAGRQQRNPGVDVVDRGGDRLGACEQRLLAGVFNQCIGHRVEAPERRARDQSRARSIPPPAPRWRDARQLGHPP